MKNYKNQINRRMLKDKEQKERENKKLESGGKLRNVFKLIDYAYGKERHYEEASRYLGVSVRTIYRYLEEIKNSGIFEVQFNSMRNGYFSITSSKKFKYHLSEDERLILAVAIELFEKVVPLWARTWTDTLKPNSSFKYLERIKKALFPKSGGIQKILDENRFFISLNPISASTSITNFEHLRNAMLNGKSVKFFYKPPGEDKIEFEVFPLAFCFKRRSWYLWAFDYRDGKRKFFRLNRIIGEVIGIGSDNKSIKRKPIKMNWEEIKKDLEKRIRRSWEFRDVGISTKEEKVKIRALTEKAFDIIKEVTWHPSQKVYDKEKTFEFKVADPTEMISFIAQFGPEIKIEEPKCLADEFKNFIKKTLEIYEEK